MGRNPLRGEAHDFSRGYITYYSRINEWERFDLERDPNELRNVVDDGQYADVFSRLKDELRDLRAKYDDDTGEHAPE